MAVFDAVVNNADRKIGHLLPVADGHLYGCDHGVCFGEEYKLRTVLWQWRGETAARPAPMQALAACRRRSADGGLAAELAALLSRRRGAARPAIRVDTADPAPRAPLPAGELARRAWLAGLGPARSPPGRPGGSAAAAVAWVRGGWRR